MILMKQLSVKNTQMLKFEDSSCCIEYKTVLRTVYVLCCDFTIDLTKIDTGIYLFKYFHQI